MSRSYDRTVSREASGPDTADTAGPDDARPSGWSGNAAPKRPRGPWILHTGQAADVDVRILSDRTDDGGTITRLVDVDGKRLHPEPIVGRPGREDEVGLVIADKVTELLRRA